MQLPGEQPRKRDPEITEAVPVEQTIEAPAPRHRTHNPGIAAFDKPAVPGEVGMLGPYQIIREIGQGGMGTVYLAVDTRLQRKLALKVMLPRFAAQPASKEPSKTYQVTRISQKAPWSIAVEVAGSADGVAPVLSPDGMELYVSIRAEINRSTRAYRRAALQKPAPVPELNGLNYQEPRWISPDGKLLLLANINGGRAHNQYWLAERRALDKPWQKRGLPMDTPGGRKDLPYASLSTLPGGIVDFYFLLEDKMMVARRVLKSAMNNTPDRHAAEWVIGYGGSLRVTGINRALNTIEELPAETFDLWLVNLNRNKTLSDAHIRELCKLPNLRELRLSSTSITDASATVMTNATQLKTLDVGATALTDAAVPQLKALKNLTTLITQRTKISAAGIAELHAALPACRIYHDGGIIEPVK